MYEVNLWLWQFGKPVAVAVWTGKQQLRLGGLSPSLSVEKTDDRNLKEAALKPEEWSLCGAETSLCCKADWT